MENFLKQHTSLNNEDMDTEDYTMRFGKYRNKTFKEVYEDKTYVAWLFKVLDQDKNQVLLDYFKERIEAEYGKSIEEKKIRKTKKKTEKE